MAIGCIKGAGGSKKCISLRIISLSHVFCLFFSSLIFMRVCVRSAVLSSLVTWVGEARWRIWVCVLRVDVCTFTHKHVGMRTHIHIYTYKCSYTCIHVHTYIHMFVHIHTHTCIYTYMHVHTFTDIHLYIRRYWNEHVHIHTYKHTHLSSYLNTHKHAFIHKYHLPILTYIHYVNIRTFSVKNPLNRFLKNSIRRQ